MVDRAERARLLREIGDHKFNEFAEIPLFWLFAEAAVNPKYVAEYTFPGVITGFFTHLEYVKLAPCGRTSSLDQCTPWFGHYILDSQLLA